MKLCLPNRLAVLLALLILAGCGATGAGEAEQNATTSAEPAAEETRTYESAKGVIELPANPERVVVIDQDYVGDVLATGLTPIGASGWVFDTPYYQDFLKGVESVGDKTTISLEKVASLTPDLILTFNEELYDSLTKIAPTVLLPYGQLDYRERLLEIGTILNRSQQAEQWLAAFDETVNKKKQELSAVIDKNETVVILEITEKELFLFGTSYGRGGELLYNELGLRAPDKVEEVAFADGWAGITLEVLPEYLAEADYILLGVRELGEENKKEIQDSPLWQDLPAVQAGRVMEYELDSFYFQDPIALEQQLEEIAVFLLSRQ
ncbi:iron-hydroxamate ABC transporter substrate-binding protein [Alkalihalobacillus oceani]|uniref:iron-hydroxamate ABC transporter substrate-binding protein n=1 Tax=Halalkalibacter oceani TaxID=1653776 RepID=UPI00203F749A|nr:iron-hydroxamate ABC transporter substrate-binding protein [Halalkalibacter oceani]MCM3761376.1 iron-hydroxamate ABC transporter substrate-binding protein [Halalkalibacter oceani]